MKAIHKLVIKAYLGPMILSTAIVLFILVMNFVWRYVDDLVGKGLGVDVIAELLLYVGINSLPDALPLAILLSAIITMGDLGENYELLAMKSAGMSLLTILKPLIILVLFISIGSFFVANDLVPYTKKKMFSLIYNIQHQKKAIEFKDGVFSNDIGNMSIRVETQDPVTNLLTDIIIYDNRKPNGDMTTTVADSGYIRISEDSKNLHVTLYNGEQYEQSRNSKWLTVNKRGHTTFTRHKGTIPLEGFELGDTDASLFKGSYSKRFKELDTWIDSLQLYSDKKNAESYEPFLEKDIFTYNKTLVSDSLKAMDSLVRTPVSIVDSIAQMDLYEKHKLLKITKNNVYSFKRNFVFGEESAKAALDQLYRYQVDWHKKLLLPVSIVVFLLIGAPLGAIIRKGGLGMPMIISILFFVTYYIISITGEKMAKEGTWDAYLGMWFAIFILTPIAAFLTYKATNDSNLFNVDRYMVLYIRGKEWLIKMINKGLKIWNNRKKH